jgi:hypothetical protein
MNVSVAFIPPSREWFQKYSVTFHVFLNKLIVLYRPDDDTDGVSKHVAWDTLLNIVNFVKLCCVWRIILSG